MNGKFTEPQKFVFNTVLEAQKQIYAEMKPGTDWAEMHRLMWRVYMSALREEGVLCGDVDEMMSAELGAVFVPCGNNPLLIPIVPT